jgi:hypothetical protein
VQSKEHIIHREPLVLLLWVNRYYTKSLLVHLKHGREIIFHVAVIWKLLHDWMVIPNLTLDARVLQHKVLDVVTEPVVDLLRCLAPKVILCRVTTVRQSYHRERVVRVLPRISNLHFVAVL